MCLILAKWPFSNSLERIILLFFILKTSTSCKAAIILHSVDNTSSPHQEHGLVFIPPPWKGCAQKVDKTGVLCYWTTYQWVEFYLITSFTYHHWPLGVSHKRCTWLWSPWNFKLQVGKLMHWHMFQALTCPLLHQHQYCTETPPPSVMF